mmetsp:Transcript_13503/g.19914  ORF Transcript_13503/g.19914 Transcript_13503/m.19914 type:complete len:677 (+) Transcript_13503:110-2140(+)|eukprot:CAMPEP_0194226468 /NCGR_PEP_ID=MMETSP0156-20130528/41925_1 /TAXON_ID=33649 /ORGANISM="Thalassionema nitzschioides, Strain L26-B" /LENGTH=676 /DNA_ID=CAMNT_0038958827 /DNA_START=37 /DNA_END=2067 /DNA_ORIENTATION=+
MESLFLRQTAFTPHHSLTLSIIVCLLLFTHLVDGELYNFHVIVKNKNNVFFDLVKEGCDEAAIRISATLHTDEIKCIFDGPDHFNSTMQAEIMKRIISQESTSGVAISVSNPTLITPLIADAMNDGIPVVTFDSDAPESKRHAYIGTAQHSFGQELGKLLLQLAPLGGLYGIVADDTPNIQERVRGVHDILLQDSVWKEIKGGKSPANGEDNTDIALKKMAELAKEPNIGAIISVGGWPMFNETGWSEFVKMNRNLKLVVGDSVDVQVRSLKMGFVDGLIGQLPYQMGQIAIEALWNVTQKIDIEEEIYGTTILQIVRFPLTLPLLHLDKHHLGDLSIMGIVFYTIIVLLSFGFLVWTWIRRTHRVVKASQPFFLIMICIGAFVLGSSIVPMGFDDERCDIEDSKCQKSLNSACMSVPWLFYPGLCTVFSALFSKLWRINIILAKSKKFTKVKIMPKDVLVPYVLLLLSNIIVLTCWTVIDPLTYVRQEGTGSDVWNRVNSSIGKCASASDSSPYTITLGTISIVTLVLANVQAFRARKVHTELSESRFIAYIMVGLLQLVLVGIPMYYLTEDNPPSHYTLKVIIVFLMSLLPLLLIFVPKIHFVIHSGRKKNRKDKAHRLGVVVQDGEPSEQEERLHSEKEDDNDNDNEAGMMAGVIDTTAIAEQSIRSRRRINT